MQEKTYVVSHWAGGHLLKETCNDVFFFFFLFVLASMKASCLMREQPGDPALNPLSF